MTHKHMLQGHCVVFGRSYVQITTRTPYTLTKGFTSFHFAHFRYPNRPDQFWLCPPSLLSSDCWLSFNTSKGARSEPLTVALMQCIPLCSFQLMQNFRLF